MGTGAAGESSTVGGVVAVVPAAGHGVRLGAGVPKAFVRLGEETMIHRAVDSLRATRQIDLVVVVAPAELVGKLAEDLGTGVLVVAGGAERTDSVRAGLSAALVAAPDARYVLVHDAARALAPQRLISDVIAALRAGARAVVPVLPVTDTIKVVDEDGVVTATPERSSLRAVQTPQGFAVDVLRRAHAGNIEAVTDDASLVERAGTAVHTIVGDPLAFKITTALDLQLAELLLAQT